MGIHGWTNSKGAVIMYQGSPQPQGHDDRYQQAGMQPQPFQQGPPPYYPQPLPAPRPMELIEPIGTVPGQVAPSPFHQAPPQYIGPVEKGKILFQEEWATKRKYKNMGDLFISGFLIFAGLVIIGIGVSLAFYSSGSMLPLLMLSMVGVVMILMGWRKFADAAKEMPFRIYENGITEASTTVAKGLKREETFIPWSAVQIVGISNTPFMTVALRQIRIVHSGGKEMVLSYSVMTDPMEALRIFAKKVPTKLAPELEVYIGPKDRRRRVPKHFPNEKAQIFGPILPLGMVAFMIIMVGALASNSLSSGHYLGLLIVSAVMGPMGILFLWMSLTLQVRAEKDVIKLDSTIVQGGIALKNRGLGIVVRKVRTFIPFQEVRMFKTKLDPLFMAHEASFILNDGAEYWLRYDAFVAAQAISGFKDEDLDLVNPNPRAMEGPLARWNALGILLIVTILGFAFPVSVMGLGQLLLVGFEAFQGVCIIVALGILAPLAFLILWLTSKRAAVGEGFWANDTGLFIPRGPEKFRFVPKAEILSIQTGKDNLGPLVDLRTTRGALKLPFSVAEKLVGAGYRVVGAENLVPLQTQAPPGYMAAPLPMPGTMYPMMPIPNQGFPGTLPMGTMPPVPPSGAHKPLRRTSGPGALLVQQSDEKTQVARKKARNLGLGLTAMGALAIGFVIYAQIFLVGGTGSFSFICLMTPIAIAILGLILGPVLLYFSMKMKPIRIYENGIIFPDLTSDNNELFVPYGQMLSIDLLDSLATKVYHVAFKAQGQFRDIPADLDGLGNHIETIRQRIGNPEFDEPDFNLMNEKAYSKLETVILAVAIIGGLIAGAMVPLILGVGGGTTGLVFGVLFFGAPISVFICIYAIVTLSKRSRILRPNKPVKLNKFIAVAVAFILLFVVGAAGVSFEPTSVSTLQDSRPLPGAYSSGTYSALTLNLTEDISVVSGASLVINDSVLQFQMGRLKQHSIFVEEGGYLELHNVTIYSSNRAYGYAFEIHGKAWISQSDIRDLYQNPVKSNGDGGLEIYSSVVLIEHSTIERSLGNCMMVVESSPNILNNLFRQCQDEAIELNGASAIIDGNHFEYNNWSITMFHGSTPIIRNNNFTNNNYGITVDGSDPVITGNHFEGTAHYTIKVYDDSHPELEGNTYSGNNGQEIASGTAISTYFRLCGIGMFVVAFIAITVVYIFVQRKNKQVLNAPRPPSSLYGQPPVLPPPPR